MSLLNANGENAIQFNFNYKMFKNNNLNEQINVPKFPIFAPEIKEHTNKLISTKILKYQIFNRIKMQLEDSICKSKQR